MKKTLLTALGITALAIPALTVYTISSPNALAGWGDGNHQERMMKRADRMLSHFDTDGSKTISLEEFQQHTMEKFTEIDADGNNEISIEEAVEGMKQIRGKMKHWHKHARHHDHNHGHTNDVTQDDAKTTQTTNS